MFDIEKAAATAAEIARKMCPGEESVQKAAAALTAPDTPVETKKRLLVMLGLVTGEAFIGPTVLHLDIVGACNLNCVYCRDHSPWIKGREAWRSMEMPFELVSRLIDEGVEMGVSVMPFLGAGEPLLHSRFADIVAKAKAAPLFFELFTNGLLFDENVAALFSDAPRARVHFSLSAATERMYAALRPGLSGELLGKAESAIRNLIAIRPKGLFVVVVHVLNRLNFREVIPMMERAIALGVDEVQYKLADFDDFSRSLRLLPEEINCVRLEVRHAQALAAAAGVRVQDNIDFQLANVNPETGNYSEGLYGRIGCNIGWELVRVRRDGEISFCCALKFLDNAHRTSLADYWQSPALKRARSAAAGFHKGKNLEYAPGRMLKDHECDYCYNYTFNVHSREELAQWGLPHLAESGR